MLGKRLAAGSELGVYKPAKPRLNGLIKFILDPDIMAFGTVYSGYPYHIYDL